VNAVLRLVRGAMAVAVVVAIATQLDVSADSATFDAVNFFSFFTILSNIAAVVVLVALVVRPALVESDRFTAVRGGATLYMFVTGLVYAVLLKPAVADLGLTESWIDTVVHVLAPIVVVADWVVAPPRTRPSVATAAGWLVFPLAWLAYTLVRAPIVDWYPYPFLDPDESGGYAGVAVACVGIAVLFALLAAGLRWWAGRGVTAGASTPAVAPPL
jgi:hypothetical protein